MKGGLESRLFTIGGWWWIGYGVLRIVFGLTLLKVVGQPLIDVVAAIMNHELIEDPNDMLYSFATDILGQHPIYITYFLAIYFIFWGIVDVTLSYNLIKHKLWAFPAAFVLIGGFIIYEIIRVTHTHSLILLWTICIDTVIFWLVWREYQRLKSHISYQNEHMAEPDHSS